MPCRVSDIGEFGLIERIESILRMDPVKEVLIGIGDDAAALKFPDKSVLLQTCDMLVEDRHFNLEWMDAFSLGRRSMAVSLSDIAAMGGYPGKALVSLCLPDHTEVEFCEQLMRGMRDMMIECNAQIVGGNISGGSEKLIIDIFQTGRAEEGKFVSRSGARAGDRIFVTGEPGSSSAGLMLLLNNGKDYFHLFDDFVKAYISPIPRMFPGILIAASGYATSMIDLSDGLSADLKHICDRSKAGAEIRLNSLLRPTGFNDLHLYLEFEDNSLILHGGDDYELLFTMRADTPNSVIEEIREETDVDITEIGRILSPESGITTIDSSGHREKLDGMGWDHFGKNQRGE